MSEGLRTTVNDALVRLAAHLGGSFALDENGVIGFEFADDVSCTVEVPASSGYFHLYAPVTSVPRATREAFLSSVLEQNHFNLLTPGSWLALDGEQVLLCRSVDGSAFDADQLPGLLLAMTEGVKEARARLVENASARSAELLPAEFLFRG